MVAGVKEVMEALVSFSTCLDVISGDLGGNLNLDFYDFSPQSTH